MSGGGGLAAARKRRPKAPIAVLIFLATLATFQILFVLRWADDNRLTSWQWTMAGEDFPRTLVLLAAAAALAYPLSRVTLGGGRLAAALFAASFAAAIPFWRQPEVIVDAARYFVQAKHLALYGVGYFIAEWGGAIGAWTDLPLVPFLYGLVLGALGEERIFIQVLTTGMFSGTVVLTFLIGRMLWDEAVGALAGVLLLAMPYLLTQVPLMLVDVPTMFLLTLALAATLAAAKRGTPGRLAVAALAVAMAMLAKYSTWPLLSVVAVVFLCTAGRGGAGTAFKGFVSVALGAGLLAGAVLVAKAPVIADQLLLLRDFQIPGLGRWHESHLSTFLFQIHPFLTSAALASVAVALWRRDRRWIIVAWMVLVLLVLDVRRIRYLLVVFPMLALMAAYALRRLPGTGIARYVAACAVASSLTTALSGYLPFLETMSAGNLKQAGAYLDTLEEGRVEVFTLDQERSTVNPAISVPLLDLHTTKEIVYRGGNTSPPSAEAIAASALRFTWEYDPPGYYAAPGDGPGRDTAVVVIMSREDQPLPPAVARRTAGHRPARTFSTSDKVFRYKTIVQVFWPL